MCPSVKLVTLFVLCCYSVALLTLIPSSAICFVFQNFDSLRGASDLLLVFKFLREFRTDRYMMIPYLRRQVKVQFGAKKIIFTMFGAAGGEYFNNGG